MGIIRSQSIRTSIITFIGFGIGGITTILGAKLVDPNVMGLTRFFISVATIVFALSNLGSITVMNKFYPWYRDQLPAPKRDIFGLVLILCGIGFLMCTAGFLIFQDLIIRKFGTKSAYVVDYYFYLIPFSLFFLLFSAFENFSYNQYKSVYPILLKEVGLRVEYLILSLLFIFGVLSLGRYVQFISIVYGVLLLLLLRYLYRQGDLVFSFSISNVTRRLAKQLITFNATLYIGSVINVIAANIDNLSISSQKGLDLGFVFELSTYISTLILLPQRNVVAIAIPVLAAAWKNRDMQSIGSIYRRSSNTMLTYAVLLFGLIWLNVDNAFGILQLDPIYYAGKPVILFLGMKSVMDMSFGVASQVTGTSNYWRVEFYSNLAAGAVAIPLNIWFLRLFGIEGNAMANLLSAAVFGIIRFSFLYFRFQLQPFSLRTLYIILLGLACYWVSQLIDVSNFYISLILRTAAFTVLYGSAVLIFRLSDDVSEAFNKFIRSKLKP
ncbi:polysaccharide biosynthesis C-terminal domain-containing protein [Chitinophaga deserti]|uniref:polysaccharide biosynthesis C-terminal domain-containing protein n=1 Tax=Chitinophaga deserti TaxID=2164099 RepID=UPI000D6ACA75|nr:polysaccharide biosynthesis C-terminal domain-containing protein [Chitinophaga deserti]